MKELLDQIFEREVKRLDQRSQKEPLDVEDLRKLDILTRALRQYQVPEKKDESLDELTTAELIALVRGGDDGEDNPKPRPQPKRKKARSKKASNT